MFPKTFHIIHIQVNTARATEKREKQRGCVLCGLLQLHNRIQSYKNKDKIIGFVQCVCKVKLVKVQKLNKK